MSTRRPRLRRSGPGSDTRRLCARAFSLLELLIVLALILILATLYYGGGSRRAQARYQSACHRNLGTLHLALELYANDFQGRFPVVPGAVSAEIPLAVLVPRFTAATAPFICPGSKDPALPEGESFATRRISYAYAMGWHASNNPAGALLLSDRQVNTQPKSRGQPLFSTDGKGPGNNHHQFGGNLLFVDGHVEKVPALAPRDLTWPSPVTLLNPVAP